LRGIRKVGAMRAATRHTARRGRQQNTEYFDW
jgi:hypothetical protein